MKAFWKTKRSAALLALLVTVLALAAGCELVIGTSIPTLEATSGTGGGTGGGSGSGVMCDAGSPVPCYTGPAGTEGKGLCKGGTTCDPDGGQAACMGEVLPVPETCADMEDGDCDGHDCVEWADLLGDAASKMAEGVALDASGNIYVVGSYSGSIVAGTTTLIAQGGGDGFLLKLDPKGTPLWGKGFGDNGFQEFEAIALDDHGNIFVGGRTFNSLSFDGKTVPAGLFVMQFDPSGSLVWVKALATMASCTSSDSNLWSVAATSTGDVVIGGYYCGNIDFGDGPIASNGRDAFVAVLRGSDGSGKVADGYWGKVFGDAQMQEIDRVAVDGMGNVVMAGKFQGTIDFGGGPITSIDGYDALLAKLDSKGNTIWYDRLGGPADQMVLDLTLAPLGNTIITGQFSQSIVLDNMTTLATGTGPNGFIAEYGPDNSFEWDKILPSASASVGVDAKGEVLLFGMFGETLDLGDGALATTGSVFNAFLAKLAPSGAVIWKRGFGPAAGSPDAGPPDAGPTGNFGIGGRVTSTSLGEPVIAGTLVGSVEFDATTVLSSVNNSGLLVAKFGF